MNGILQSLFIICMLLIFICTVFWAWSSKRKDTFDAAAKLPLAEDEKEDNA